MSYKVLAPCVVRQDGGKSAKHYMEVGVEIEVEDSDDAELLVAGGFLEPVGGAVPQQNAAVTVSPKAADKVKSGE